MEIQDAVFFKSILYDLAKRQAESVAGEVGTITAIETRDGEICINVTFPSYGEFIGVSPLLFDSQNQ